MINVGELRTSRTHVFVFQSLQNDYSYYLVCGRYFMSMGERLFHVLAIKPMNEDELADYRQDPWNWEGSNSSDSLSTAEQYINDGTFVEDERLA